MAKGVKTGGRVKGTPNKLTAEAREAFRLVYDKQLPRLDGWLRRTAKENPGKAAELVVRMAEHFVPKLAHTTIAGDGDAPAIIERVVHVVKE